MELIQEIFDREIDSRLLPAGRQGRGNDKGVGGSDIRYRLRRAARALIFKENKIAVLSAEALHLHQLPGGGVEENETILEALEREVLEETGCIINQIRELGIIIEYRNEIELIQVSYVFTADVQDNSRQPVFTGEERDEGFVLEWMTVEEAIDVMRTKDKPDTYTGRFRGARDRTIMEYYLNKK